MKEILSVIVQLASIGTAGICVFAIFWIGYQIQRLPNDAPKDKYKLMNQYMVVCVTIAAICLVSGVSNAYFNRNKINAANEQRDEAMRERDKVVVGYQRQLRGLESQKRELSESLTSLTSVLNQRNMLVPLVDSSIESTQDRINRLGLKPADELLKK